MTKKAITVNYVQTDIVITISHALLEQSQWNLQGKTISSCWWPS